MNTKFSKWIKTDLHIHTDYSNKTKSNDYKSSFSVDVLLGKVRETFGVNMTLTDHTSQSGYEDIMYSDALRFSELSQMKPCPLMP